VLCITSIFAANAKISRENENPIFVREEYETQLFKSLSKKEYKPMDHSDEKT